MILVKLSNNSTLDTRLTKLALHTKRYVDNACLVGGNQFVLTVLFGTFWPAPVHSKTVSVCLEPKLLE